MNKLTSDSAILILGLILIIPGCSNHSKRILTLSNDQTGYTVQTSKGSCLILEDRIDPYTALRITDLAPVDLFNFTHEKLKDYYDTNPFITCSAFLSGVDHKQVLLNLQFEINLKHIEASYNGLLEDALLRIDLIDGQRIFLQNIAEEKVPSSTREIVIYQGIYSLTRKDQQILGSTEIDRIGVIWNGGYESYPVYEIDFFIRQLACLKKLK